MTWPLTGIIAGAVMVIVSLLLACGIWWLDEQEKR